jgi:hypothetical protein
MSYKRPNPRPRWNVPTQFVSTTLPGGGVASRWAPITNKHPIPSGHPSVVGQILDKMRRGSCPTGPVPTVWTPPVEYEFIAKHLDNPEAFLKRCEDWFAQNPSVAPTTCAIPPSLNLEPVAALYKKWGIRAPPIAEREKAWRLAGYSEAKIQKALGHHKRMQETADARQTVIDLIFAKFPSANKPTPKPKAKKAIKVVKKKMPSSINE